MAKFSNWAALLNIVLAGATMQGCGGKERAFLTGTGAESGGAAGEGDAQMTAGTGGGDPAGVQVEPAPSEQLGPVGLTPADAPGGPGVSSGASCIEGSTEACGPAAEQGICKFGTRTCTGGVWSECAGAVLGSARDCSSPADNDCDGNPDNTVDDVCRCPVMGTQPCEEHPGLDDRGPCRAGVQTCVLAEGNASSDWSACSGSVGPASADSCGVPGDDSNCDGTPNAGCSCVEGAIVPCGPDTVDGICQSGTSVCSGGAFTACQGAVFPLRRDCGSAQDNDCDGLPDDTLDGNCTCEVGSQRECGDAPDSFGCARGVAVCQATADGRQSAFAACRFDPVEDDSSCSDANVLTLGDSCQQGSCVGAQWGRLAAGNGGVCAVRAGGTVYCWAPLFNAVFDGPPEAVSLSEPARSVSVGARQACAVLESGGVRCWGSNDAGQLGTGNTSSAPASAPATTSLAAARLIVAGAEGTMGLDSFGTARVWGSLPAAISGISAARLPALTPTAVAGVNGATMLALGARHGCALLPNQQVYCWGQNEFLQLGGGEQTPTAAFLIVPNLTDAVAIEAGQTSTCALRSNGEVSCWGALGCSSTLCAVGPTDVPALVDARQVSVGGGTACALRSGGAVVCWGAVGNGAVAIPTPVPGLDDAVALAATDELDGHCAERASGEVVCWRSSLELEPVVGLPN